jgi:ABC-type uncharacterized transport system substrate-binding protein
VKRREFIAGLGSAAVGPIAARAQQPAIPVVGYLGSRSPASDAQFVAAFLQGLGEAGYAEGRNVMMEFRWADSQLDQLPKLAAELVGRQVAVIVTTGGAPPALAAKAATATIPIVFTTGVDPVARGLVRSLNRPGENLTGVTVFSTPLGQKRLQLLGDAVPQASVIAVLANPDVTGVEQTNDLKAAASTLRRSVRMVLARTTAEIDAAFAIISQERIRALLISSDSLFVNRLDQIVALATRHSDHTELARQTSRQPRCSSRVDRRDDDQNRAQGRVCAR